MQPDPPQRLGQRLSIALQSHRRGELQKARALYRAILEGNPACFDALHLLGVATMECGALEEGIQFLRRALAVDPSQASAHYSLANALLKQNQAAAALACLESALCLEPQHADAWFLRGNVLQQTGDLEASVASYERALKLRPAFAAALNNLSVVWRTLRHVARALPCVDRALAIQPDYASAHNNRGLILLDVGRAEAAVDSFRKAVALNRSFPQAQHNLGTALMQLGRFDEACDAFEQLAGMAPDFPHVAGNLLHAKLCCCDWSDFDLSVRRVTTTVERGQHGDVPMSFLSVSGSAALQLRCAQSYTRAHFPEQAAPAAIRSDRHDRIRVAYLSGDFGEHAVSYLLAGVFERHDASRFDIVALSWDRQPEGGARRRIQSAFTRFIDVTSMSDADVVRLMHDMEVDIAVDLTGHTHGHRTGIFARRAAPVQVNYLGMPATMGASYMDYLIGDRFLVPDEQRIHYAERVVWLPESFQPNDDRRTPPAPSLPRGAYGLPERGFVFCSFNNPCKLTPHWFGAWMQLLESVPGSVLWLLAPSAGAERNLRREAESRGIDSSRLVFANRVPYADYLARYGHADLFLDTLPFNAGATASDALSMGVPVLTCAGDSFASRMAGALMSNLGLGELVAGSLEEYTETAFDLAIHAERLRRIREQLRQRRHHHPFFDTDGYRRHLETAYRTMWQRHAAGLPPAAFSVPADGS